MKKARGFTLIELLVVIAIIGLLSSVILASLNAARAKARDAQRLSDLNQLVIALALYYDTNKTYPYTGTSVVSTDLVPLVPASISSLPHDPLDPGTHGGGAGYRYIGSSNPANYIVMASLERTNNWCWLGDPPDPFGWYLLYPHC